MDTTKVQDLSSLKEIAHAAMAALATLEEVASFKTDWLGKKGRITELMKGLGALPPDARKEQGGKINQLKGFIEAELEIIEKKLRQEEIAKKLSAERIDITLDGVKCLRGSIHPVMQVMDEMQAIFRRMGFDICTGPEIETDWYNFEALNIPPDHPARDMQDTFYLPGGHLLRTHTSPVQIRVMESTQPPIAMVAPGVVYRRDSDMTHTPMFHQLEALYVDEGIHFGHLKAVVKEFLQSLFGTELKTQFRPSFFPFTEPSAEVDMSCVFCKGSGCRVCKGTGFIEIMGCGMVDPAVFKNVGIDTARYSGFAFGVGIERVTMLKYGINDLRLFFENDVRFLEQFS